MGWRFCGHENDDRRRCRTRWRPGWRKAWSPSRSANPGLRSWPASFSQPNILKPAVTSAPRHPSGSEAEADDAVQEAWLKLNSTDARDIENIGGWLTTVVARV